MIGCLPPHVGDMDVARSLHEREYSHYLFLATTPLAWLAEDISTMLACRDPAVAAHAPEAVLVPWAEALSPAAFAVDGPTGYALQPAPEPARSAAGDADAISYLQLPREPPAAARSTAPARSPWT